MEQSLADLKVRRDVARRSRRGLVLGVLYLVLAALIRNNFV